MIEKAQKLVRLVIDELSVDDQTYLNFSGGWLTKFKMRQNWSPSSSMEKVERWTRRNCHQKPQRCKILFPSTTYVICLTLKSQVSSTNRPPTEQKRQITCQWKSHRSPATFFYVARVLMRLLSCLSSLPETMRSHAIFKKKPGEDHGIYYSSALNASMNGSIVFVWLEYFESKILKRLSRNVLLLMDKCSAQKSEQQLSNLTHLCINSILPSIPSKSQLLDAETVAATKLKCTEKQMK